MSDDDQIGIEEACRILGRSRTTVERLLRSSDFPAPVQLMKGGHRKWRRADIERIARKGLRKPISGDDLPRAAPANPHLTGPVLSPEAIKALRRGTKP